MSGYHLCSDNYKNTIFKGFSTLQHQEELVDLTLAAEGHLVKVHKNIIAVASPYIKALLRSAPCSSPVIFLNNVKHNILQLIIAYIYQGEVDVPELLLEEFIQVGKALHINGINTIPKKTSVVLPATTVVKKPESSNNVAAHIRIDNINNNHSLEVLQTILNDPPVPSSIPIVEQNNPNIIQISYGNDIQSGFQTNNNFVIGNNLQNDIGYANDFAIANDLGNSNITVIDPAINNDNGNNIFTIGNDFNTGNDMVTVTNFATGNDIPIEASNFTTENDIMTGDNSQTENNFAISNDIATGNIIITVAKPQNTNDICIGKDLRTENATAADNIETDNDVEDGNYVKDGNLECGNDIVTDSNLQTSNETVTASNLQSASHSGKTKSFDYNITVQRLDTVNGLEEPVPDTNTELDKIDAKDLKGMAQYSITERDSTQLILNRFIYGCHYESKNGKRRRWRCIDYRRSHCPAFVETDDGLIVKRKGLHCHSFHDKKIYDKHKKCLIFSSEGVVKEYLSNKR